MIYYEYDRAQRTTTLNCGLCDNKKASAEYHWTAYHLPDYSLHRIRTQTAARPPEEEGEAARNNVVMSA